MNTTLLPTFHLPTPFLFYLSTALNIIGISVLSVHHTYIINIIGHNFCTESGSWQNRMYSKSWLVFQSVGRDFRLGKLQKKTFFLGYLSQMWVGGVADSQTRSKPKIAFFDPNFTFCFPKSHKNPGMGSQIWENFPPEMLFFMGA